MAPDLWDVVVVGGGPAGLMAAGTAAAQGARTLLVEKNPECGQKLLITGSGRCNLLPADPDPRRFLAAIGAGGTFLRPALGGFPVAEARRFFEGLGLALEVEGDKLFPRQGGARAVRDALVGWVRAHGAEVRTGAGATGVVVELGAFALGDGVRARRVVLATGGLSYPRTGCTGDGHRWARELGLLVTPTAPALTPVAVTEPWVVRLEGSSLQDAGFTVHRGEEVLARARGDAVFTRDGLSGPAIYRLSRLLAGVDVAGTRLVLARFPDAAPGEVAERLRVALERQGGRQLKNILAGFLPPRLLPVVLERAEAEGTMHGATVSRALRARLVDLLCAFDLTVARFHGYGRATITAGGVGLDEVDPRTLESRRVAGLHFAGELLDLDGPTGGYNLHICWCTGRLAGAAAAGGASAAARGDA